jgi:hypothetical protein
MQHYGFKQLTIGGMNGSVIHEAIYVICHDFVL